MGTLLSGIAKVEGFKIFPHLAVSLNTVNFSSANSLNMEVIRLWEVRRGRIIPIEDVTNSYLLFLSFPDMWLAHASYFSYEIPPPQAPKSLLIQLVFYCFST